ncbi:MAG: hypothetical protein CMO98_06285, partial [Woeseia sp.]|nr:hypothetical protein [Woeseia sp.]
FAIPSVDWDEDSLTGNDYPTSFSNSSYATADIAKNDRGDYLEIDITDVAQDWFDGGDNYGIAILPTSGDNARVKFGSQRISSKRPEVVMETTDSLSIPYEPFSVSHFSPDRTDLDTRIRYVSFYPPAKVTYSNVTMLFSAGLPSSGYACSAVIGVAIYSADTSYPYGPTSLIKEGSLTLQLGELDNYEFQDVPFDSSITLRPTNRYWFAVGADRDGACEVFAADFGPHAGSTAYEALTSDGNVYYSATGFPETPSNGETESSAYDRIWFRLIP